MSQISIHALREEGDFAAAQAFFRASEISIHALREEGDQEILYGQQFGQLFLSTPSVRRATKYEEYEVPGRNDFYPRPP